MDLIFSIISKVFKIVKSLKNKIRDKLIDELFNIKPIRKGEADLMTDSVAHAVELSTKAFLMALVALIFSLFCFIYLFILK